MSDVPSAPTGAPLEPDALLAARAAIARRAWQEAFDLLGSVDADQELSGADLEALAEAAFFIARPDVEDEAKERAFKAYLASGDELRAAYLAVDLARHAHMRGRPSMASGWVRRAERILGEEGETYAHGYLVLARSEIAGAAGDMERALALAARAVEIGDRAADPDLRAWSLGQLGELKIAGGDTPEGLALLEEASIAAVNGELRPFTSGVTACRMIAACRDLSDYGRATEWIEATERYCERHSLTGFPGVCRVHRAEVEAMGGAWDRAEEHLREATAELERYRATVPQADGYYALGDLRRLRGDFEGAEAALREAHARGRSPQPALALMRLAQGRVRASVAAIDAAVDEAAWNRWARARLLPAQVEILLAAGDVPRARASLQELEAIVGEYPSPAFEAGRLVASGRVLLADGDPAGAARELRAGLRRWREVGAPYEVARARALLALALRALGDEEDADLELEAALDAFDRLGATVDAALTRRWHAGNEERRREPEQVHRTFMFTDIVGSTRLAEALGDAAWERLLRWHDDTLRRLIAAAGGEIVNSTGDGFFAAFLSPRAAVDSAVSIQRALRDHQEAMGFAPEVRIGIHTADAVRRGHDYSGVGVHVTARVGALAAGGEILATEDALRDAGEVLASPPREVVVRGVAAQVRVASVTWR